MPVLLPELRFRTLWALGGAGIVLVIAWFCLLPGDDVPDVNMSDKFQHLLAFVALALWFGGITGRRHFLAIGVVLIAYGGLIELAQGWLQWGRQAEWLDLRADAFGVVIGLLLALTPLGRWAHWLESLQRRIA
jgi:VanZ family protein